MSAADFQVLLPLLLLAYGATALLVLGAFWKNHTAMAALALLIFAGALAGAVAIAPLAPRQVTPLLRIDALALFYIGLFAGGGIVLTVLAWDYFREGEGGREPFYALLLFATLGMGVLAASSHFASFFLGLETLSVALFGLIGYPLGRRAAQEGSIKYLILAGSSSAFLLLGMALLYAECGTMEFGPLAAALLRGPSLLALLGLAFVLIAFAFKLAWVPFHAWAPDVYQGAPAPVSALVATGSKAAMFALLLRLAPVFWPSHGGALTVLLTVLALLTMTVGNLLALLQRNLKRLLAYSSIAHMGYLLLPLLAGGATGTSALSFYFISYFITTIGAFGVVAALARRSREFEDLAAYRGLGFRRPALGAALGAMMLSLAGIPLTIGFMAKLAIFAAAAQAGLWLLLIAGVANSGISGYYYLQVLVALYSQPAAEARWPAVRPVSAVSLLVLSLALIYFGIFPGWPLHALRGMADSWMSQAEGRIVLAPP